MQEFVHQLVLVCQLAMAGVCLEFVVVAAGPVPADPAVDLGLVVGPGHRVAAGHLAGSGRPSVPAAYFASLAGSSAYVVRGSGRLASVAAEPPAAAVAAQAVERGKLGH